MNEDLKIIKKKYGEKMAHLCRDLFPTILEKKGLLSYLLLSHFEPNHELYNDIIKEELKESFKNYIYGLLNIKRIENKSDKTPKELLLEAGYQLFECHTEEDIQQFKKYFEKEERLCTFNGGRLDSCHVFFAVKKDVDNIKREAFKNPKRQDKYGTSVISIQFIKNKNHTLSIKNRYNHTVNNPDATFSNNLDNIIPGLTLSFKKEYGLIERHPSDDFEMPNYVLVNGKYYKYNYELNNIYYCPNNIIIDNFKVKKYDKEKYLIIDYFILDLVNKKIDIYDKTLKDSFINDLKEITKINIIKNKNQKLINIKIKNQNLITITLDKENNIIGYKNNNIKIINKCFLFYNEKINNIELNNVKIIGNYFLYNNEVLPKISLPEVLIIYNKFLNRNKNITSLNIPKVKIIKNDFLAFNNSLTELEVPCLEEVGDRFLSYNKILNKLESLKLEKVKDNFLMSNLNLQELNLPNLKRIDNYFLSSNKQLNKLIVPNLETIGDFFLINNQNLKRICFPNLKETGNYFLNGTCIEELIAPNLIIAGSQFMTSNNTITILYLPNLITTGISFLGLNNSLKKLYLPSLKEVKEGFLNYNKKLETIYLPQAKKISSYYFLNSTNIKDLNIDSLEEITDNYILKNNLVD